MYDEWIDYAPANGELSSPQLLAAARREGAAPRAGRAEPRMTGHATNALRAGGGLASDPRTARAPRHRRAGRRGVARGPRGRRRRAAPSSRRADRAAAGAREHGRSRANHRGITPTRAATGPRAPRVAREAGSHWRVRVRRRLRGAGRPTRLEPHPVGRQRGRSCRPGRDHGTIVAVRPNVLLLDDLESRPDVSHVVTIGDAVQVKEERVQLGAQV